MSNAGRDFSGGRGILTRSIARRTVKGEGDVVNPSQRTHKGQRGNSVCVRTAGAGGEWSNSADRRLNATCLECVEGHLTKVALTGSDRKQSKVLQLPGAAVQMCAVGIGPGGDCTRQYALVPCTIW